MWGTRSKRLVFPCLVVFSLPAVFEAANCSNEVGNHREVFNSSDVEELADSLVCPGSTQLMVDWYGQIEISRSLNLRNGSALNITGLDAAVIKGNGTDRLFTVSGGATLSLESITIEGGRAPDGEYGGAISANESSNLNLHNCSFMNNNATLGGGGSCPFEWRLRHGFSLVSQPTVGCDASYGPLAIACFCRVNFRSSL